MDQEANRAAVPSKASPWLPGDSEIKGKLQRHAQGFTSGMAEEEKSVEQLTARPGLGQRAVVRDAVWEMS